MMRDLAAKRDKRRVSVLAHLSELAAGCLPPGHCCLCAGMGKADSSQEQGSARCFSLSSGSSSVSAGAILGAVGHPGLERTMKGTVLEICRLQHPSATTAV